LDLDAMCGTKSNNIVLIYSSLNKDVHCDLLLINGTLFCSIRNVTAEVGAAVIGAAVAEKQAEGHGDVGLRELSNMSKVWKFQISH